MCSHHFFWARVGFQRRRNFSRTAFSNTGGLITGAQGILHVGSAGCQRIQPFRRKGLRDFEEDSTGQLGKNVRGGGGLVGQGWLKMFQVKFGSEGDEGNGGDDERAFSLVTISFRRSSL